MSNDAWKTLEEEWLDLENSLVYVRNVDTESRHQSQVADDPSAAYAPAQQTEALVPYEAETYQDMTPYQKALEESWLFRQPIAGPYSDQEPYHQVVPPTSVSVPGPAPKRGRTETHRLDEQSMLIDRDGGCQSESLQGDSVAEDRSTSSQCWELVANSTSYLCDRPEANADSEMFGTRLQDGNQEGVRDHQPSTAASSRDPTGSGAVSAPIAATPPTVYQLGDFVFNIPSGPGSRLTASHIDALNVPSITDLDQDDDNSKSDDSWSSLHTEQLSSENSAYAAEQRLDGFVAPGRLRGGFGGRPWEAQGQKRKKDRRQRAALHQMKNNWATGQAPVPRDVQRRLGLCVLRNGQPVEVEQTAEGAAQLAQLFSRMLEDAKRS